METYNAHKLRYNCRASGQTKDLDLKIGLHCGSVTSAVIGKSRTFFRLFGDTVNVASRIGCKGKTGQITGTEKFHDELSKEKSELPYLIDMSYETCYQGKVHLKGKGEMSCFSFHGIPSHLSVKDGHGTMTSELMTGTNESKEEPLNEKTGISDLGTWSMHQRQTIVDKSSKSPAVNLYSNACSIQGSFGSNFEPTLGHNMQLETLEHIRPMEKAHKRIAVASKLLEIPVSEVAGAYKEMPQDWLSMQNTQYVKQVERLGILQFVDSLTRSRKKAPVAQGKGEVYKYQSPISTGDRLGDGIGEITPERKSCTKNVSEEKDIEMKKIPSSEFHSGSFQNEASQSSSVVDDMFLPARTSFKKDRNICSCRMRRYLEVKFADESLEKFYDWRRKGLSYSMIDNFFAYMAGILMVLVALYYHLIFGEEVVLIIIGVLFGASFVGGNALMKKFRVLFERRNDNDTMDTKLFNGAFQAGSLDTQSRRGSVSRRRRSDDLSPWSDEFTIRNQSNRTNPGTCSWVGNVAPQVETFSYWVTPIVLIFSFGFMSLDQLLLQQSVDELGTHEACLQSFLLPSFLLVLFPLFEFTARVLVTVLSGIILFHVLLLSASNFLLDCNGYVQCLGFLCLLAIAINGAAGSVEDDTRARRSLVARLASKRANSQADTVADRLFPAYVTEMLKEDKPIPFEDVHNEVVILWADLVGFTSLSSTLDSFEVMQMLDRLYSKFDERVERKSMWKMDTIGDAYIIIGGLVNDANVKSSILVGRMFSLALNMLSDLRNFNNEHNTDISLRIGIHTGQVGSGIAGSLRPRFYVFGETVLYAEQMESTGQPGYVHVSKEAVELYTGSQFPLRPRESDGNSYWLGDTKARAQV